MKKAIKKISGIVTRGKGRGRSLGFATANIAYDAKVPIEYGIYACWAEVGGKRFSAAVSVGVNEMFGAKTPTIEAHLLDFSGDIYGENVEIVFVKRVREMERFNTVEALQEQIKNDVEEVRKTLQLTSDH